MPYQIIKAMLICTMIALPNMAFAQDSPDGSAEPVGDMRDLLENQDRAEELGTLLAREEGKTLAEAKGEVGRASQVFKFFAGVTPTGVTMMTDISRYLDFVLKMFFAFGLAFEIPVATLLLSWSGLTTADKMAAKRPYVIVGCFIVGMLLTPPDVISQLLLAVPTWLLFEVGVLLSRFAERQRATRQAQDSDTETGL